MKKILFVCGKNQWRSPTADRIYKNDMRLQVRTAGIKNVAKHTISKKDIEWCDLILVMEYRYKDFIRERFNNMKLPPIYSLEIPDKYEFMDTELVELIKSGTEPYID